MSMKNFDEDKFSQIACRLIGLTFILKKYCLFYAENFEEFAALYELSEILDDTSNRLFDLI